MDSSNNNKSIFERHRRLSNLTLMMLSLAVTLLILEFGFRFARDAIKGSSWISRAENIDDDDLGWSLNPQKQPLTKANACGETVVRGTPASRYLNRVPATGKGGTTVLFVGDSFTQGTEVSSNALYYEIFEQASGGRYAVAAAGAGGFSTAQEYLLLEKVFQTIRPRIVFWQLTGNDLPENVYTGTDISAVQKPRAYYDPASDSFHLRNPSLWLLRHSELAKYVYGEMLKIERTRPFGLSSLISWLTPADDPSRSDHITRHGLKVMQELIGKARKAHPETLFIGFSVDSTWDKQYQTAFESQGALYFAGLPEKISKAGRGERLDCAPVDPHWNHAGNRVAGEVLLQLTEQVLAASPASRQKP